MMRRRVHGSVSHFSSAKSVKRARPSFSRNAATTEVKRRERAAAVALEVVSLGKPDGIARLGGRSSNAGKIALVRGGVPGDTVWAVPESDDLQSSSFFNSPDRGRRKGASAERFQAVAVQQAGACRVDPFCAAGDSVSLAGEESSVALACRGCPWQCVSKAAQHHALKSNLEHVLRRTGVPPESFTVSDVVSVDQNRVGWRRTVRVVWGGDPQRPVLGYVAGFGSVKGGSSPSQQGIGEVASCPVMIPSVARLYESLRDRLLPQLVETVPQGGAIRITGETEDRPGENGGASATAAFAPRLHGRESVATTTARVAPLVRSFVDEVGPDICRGAVVIGKQRVWESFGHPLVRVGDLGVPHGAHSFIQANYSVNRLLVEHVVAVVKQFLSAAGKDTSQRLSILDLYAGCGNISFSLARATGAEVLAVESAIPTQFVLDAREDVFLPQGSVKWHYANVEEAALSDKYDIIVLNPPRAGAKAALKIIDSVLARCSQVVYVSCDASTLARDLRFLHDRGWAIEQLTPFDMIPHTGHAEFVAVVRR